MCSWKSDESFADKVAKSCCEIYKKLPKKGKPQKNREWTTLAGIAQVLQKGDNYTVKVVCLGTGTRCIGAKNMTLMGDVVHDSHAEVIVRRVFLRYLYHQLYLAYDGNADCIFEYKESSKKCSLKHGVTFHLYTSQIPCGDSSIFPKHQHQDSIGSVVKYMKEERRGFCSSHNKTCSTAELKSRLEDTSNLDYLKPKREKSLCTDMVDEPCIKKVCLDKDDTLLLSAVKTSIEKETDIGNDLLKDCSVSTVNDYESADKCETRDKLERGDITRKCENSANNLVKVHVSEDIYRTGAKCVPGGNQDPLCKGSNYHTIGVLRTKPGRGHPTQSMSCSDKMMRWIVLGVQGALISYFLESSIHFDSVIVGKSPFDKLAMTRALCERALKVKNLPIGFEVKLPIILQSAVEFEDSRLVIETATEKIGIKCKAAPSAIIWCSLPNIHEVGVNGYKQGVTKAADSSTRSLGICKAQLFHVFKELLITVPSYRLPDALMFPLNQTSSYRDYKIAADLYWKARGHFMKVFPTWLITPGINNNFSLP